MEETTLKSRFVFLYRIPEPGLTVREECRAFIGSKGMFWILAETLDKKSQLLSFDYDDLERGIVAELGDEIVFVTNDSRVASLWE